MPEGGSSAREAFSMIYARHFKAVLGFAIRRTPSREDAADVVAETFLVTWRRMGDRPQEDLERAWLFGVARGALANARRGDMRRSRLTEALAAASRVPEVPSMGAGPVVERAFASLGVRDRELLELAYWEELSPREIATVLGCTPNAARIRLHRARRLMRDRLAAAERGAGPIPPKVIVQPEEAS